MQASERGERRREGEEKKEKKKKKKKKKKKSLVGFGALFYLIFFLFPLPGINAMRTQKLKDLK